jgi:hypothetical protein
MRFPGVPRTKSSILLTIRIHQIRWRVTGLPTTSDAFNAIPRPACWAVVIITNNSHYYYGYDFAVPLLCAVILQQQQQQPVKKRTRRRQQREEVAKEVVSSQYCVMKKRFTYVYIRSPTLLKSLFLIIQLINEIIRTLLFRICHYVSFVINELL